MIVRGGQNGSSTLNDGARYNPVSDSWIPTTFTGAPGPRNVEAAVWTGNQMIIWGGSSNSDLGAANGYLNDTYSYTMAVDTTPPTVNCPANLSVGCSVERLAAVSFPAPTASDDSGVPPAVTCAPASGSALGHGT